MIEELNPEQNTDELSKVKKSLLYKAMTELTNRLDNFSIKYTTKISLDENLYGHAWIKVFDINGITQIIYLCSHSELANLETCEGMSRFITVYHYATPLDIDDFDSIPVYQYKKIEDASFTEDQSASTYYDNVIYYLENYGIQNYYKRNESDYFDKVDNTDYPNKFKPLNSSSKCTDDFSTWPVIDYDDTTITVDGTKYSKDKLITEDNVTYFGLKVNKKLKYYFENEDNEQYDDTHTYLSNGNIKCVVHSTSSSMTVCPRCFGKGHIYTSNGDALCSFCHNLSWDIHWAEFNPDDSYQTTILKFPNDYTWPDEHKLYYQNIAKTMNFRNLHDKTVSYVAYNCLGYTDHLYYSDDGNINKSPNDPIITKNKVLLPDGTYDYGVWFELINYSEQTHMYDAVMHYHLFSGNSKNIIKNSDIEIAKKYYIGERTVFIPSCVGNYKKDFWFSKNYSTQSTVNSWVRVTDSFEIEKSTITLDILIPCQWLNYGEPNPYYLYGIDGYKINGPYYYGTVKPIGFSTDNLDGFNLVYKLDRQDYKQSELLNGSLGKTFDYPWDYDSIINFVVYKDHNVKPIGIPDTVAYTFSTNPITDDNYYALVYSRNFAMSPCEVDNDFNKLGRFLNANMETKQEFPIIDFIDKFKEVESGYNYDEKIKNYLSGELTGDSGSRWHMKGLDRTNAFGLYESVYNQGKDAYIWCQTNAINFDASDKCNLASRDYTGCVDTVEFKEDLTDKYIGFEHYKPIQAIYYKKKYSDQGNLLCGNAVFYDNADTNKWWYHREEYNITWESDTLIETDVIKHNTPEIVNNYGWASELKPYQISDTEYRHVCPTCHGMGVDGINQFKASYPFSAYGSTLPVEYGLNSGIMLHSYFQQHTLNCSTSVPFNYSYRMNTDGKYMRCPTCAGCGVEINYLYYKHDLVLPNSLSGEDWIDEYKENVILYEKKNGFDNYSYWIKGMNGTVPAWQETTLEKIKNSHNTVMIKVDSKEDVFAILNPSQNLIAYYKNSLIDGYKFWAWAYGFAHDKLANYSSIGQWCPIYFDETALSAKSDGTLIVNNFEESSIVADSAVHLHNNYEWACHSEDGYNSKAYQADYYNKLNYHALSALWEVCSICNGTGYDSDGNQCTCKNGFNKIDYDEDYSIVICSNCSGTGKYIDEKSGTEIVCPVCNGKKIVADFGEQSQLLQPDRKVSDKKIYKYTIRQKLNTLDNISVEVTR